ncbi:MULTISPECIES: DNA-binding domain-containing protein [unclassified Saccharothrix]|uniref:DNA-binding domain-containing protein n=1 Tax=unclassified Saccharothrix TaxID=2593673 RepID=UPI00307E6230
MREPDLADLQRWLLTACTGGQLSRRPSEVVRDSGRLTAEDRVAIYARGYRARLRECLKSEFSVLHALVGDQVFALFADAYIAAHPPASYSMADLGAAFADFLHHTRPQPLSPPGSPDALPTALARLDRARSESRRAAGVESDPTHRPIDPVLLMTTPDLPLRTPPTLRLLHLDFALLDTVTAADHGHHPPVPTPQDTHYAVTRTNYRVHLHALTPWQHTFLHTATNTTLHTATTTTAHAHGLPVPRVLAGLFTWLPWAVEAGMVTAPPDRRAPDRVVPACGSGAASSGWIA